MHFYAARSQWFDKRRNLKRFSVVFQVKCFFEGWKILFTIYLLINFIAKCKNKRKLIDFPSKHQPLKQIKFRWNFQQFLEFSELSKLLLDFLNFPFCCCLWKSPSLLRFCWYRLVLAMIFNFFGWRDLLMLEKFQFGWGACKQQQSLCIFKNIKNTEPNGKIAQDTKNLYKIKLKCTR